MRAGWHIRSQSIPQQAIVQVKPGQQVALGDELATISALPGPLVRVDAAEEIGAAPRDLTRHVVRPVGAEVKQNQVLALTNAFGYPLAAVSPVAGTVARISRSLGCVYVRKWLDIPRSEIRIELLRRKQDGRTDAPAAIGISFSGWDTVKSTLVVKEYCVNAGDYVQRGQTLAVTFWSRPELVEEVRAPVISPCVGLVKDIDRDGAVIVIEPKEATGVAALYPGQVLSVAPDSVELALRATRFTGSYGIGGVATGQLAVDGPPVPGCIWVIPRQAALSDLEMGRAAKVAGIWATSAHHSDLEGFAGADRLRSVTGAWDGPVVVLSEGFGELPMSPETLVALRALSGRQAVINGTTHLRAGAIRPELLIPEDGHQLAGPAVHEPDRWSAELVDAIRAQVAETDAPPTDWSAGMRVCGIWGHRQGWRGVTQTAPHPATLANGVNAHVIEVRWANGTTDTVPIRNLTADGGWVANE